MLEKLFESLDEKVFTPELKDSLVESFNDAVEAKVQDKIDELSEKSEEHIDLLSEKAEDFKTMLEEEAKEKEEALLEQVDMYLEKVVDEFIVEAEEKLETNLVNEKADLMVEAFDTMLVAGGVDVQKIVEAKEETEAEHKLEESIEKYDALIEENIRLEKENAELIKLGVIAEMSAGMSILEAEKFTELAELVEFEKSEEYAEKLNLIKENIKEDTGANPEDKRIDEDVKPKNYSHLI